MKIEIVGKDKVVVLHDRKPTAAELKEDPDCTEVREEVSLKFHSKKAYKVKSSKMSSGGNPGNGVLVFSKDKQK